MLNVASTISIHGVTTMDGAGEVSLSVSSRIRRCRGVLMGASLFPFLGKCAIAVGAPPIPHS